MKFSPLITLLVLTSCGLWTVGPDYKRPKETVPQNWEKVKETNLSRKKKANQFERLEYRWWKNFNDPILNRVVSEAIANNSDYKIAQSRLVEARASVSNATSKLLPKASLKASGSRSSNYFNFFQPNSKNSIVNFFSTGFDSSWELDLFGGNARSRQAAKALYEASDNAKNDILISVIAEVVKNYSEVRAAQNDLIFELKINKYYREINKMVYQKNKAGIVGDIDLGKVKIEMLNSEINLSEAQKRVETAIYNLGILLNKRPKEIQALVGENKKIPVLANPAIVEAPITVLRRRPDVKQAERELEAATALKGAAIADFFPKISLTGFFGFNNTRSGKVYKASSRVFSAGAQAQMPIFNLGGVISQYKISEEKRKQALIMYRSKVNNALNDIESALVNFVKEDEKYDLSAEKMKVAKMISHLNQERYTRGIISYPDYLRLKISLLETRKSFNQRKLDFAKKTVSLYKALGGGWK